MNYAYVREEQKIVFTSETDVRIRGSSSTLAVTLSK